MSISIDSKCIVRGEEKHLNKLNDFLNSIKDDKGHVEFDRLCDYIPIYDPNLETSDIRANLDNNELTEINGENVLLFWVHGWKGDYLDYIKQLIKDKELGFYDKDSENRSVLALFYLSYIECSEYCITNDEDQIFFEGRLLLATENNDDMFFYDEEEVIDWLKENMSDAEISDLNDLDEIMEKLSEEDYYADLKTIKTESEIKEEEEDW